MATGRIRATWSKNAKKLPEFEISGWIVGYLVAFRLHPACRIFRPLFPVHVPYPHPCSRRIGFPARKIFIPLSC
jgi:hypothetical protein